MSGAPAGVLLVVAALLVLPAVMLSAGETALLRVSRTALAELAASDAPVGRRLQRVADDQHSTASAAAFVRVLCEALAAVAATLGLAATGLRWWQVLALAAVVVAAVAVVVVRHVPRTLGRRHPVGTLRLTAGWLVGARVLTTPLGSAGAGISEQHELTDDELRDMVDRVSESEHMQDEEREMFRSVLELGDTITRAVMVPRTDMITLPSGTPLRKAMSLFLRSGYSRVPVVGESVDDVLGVLYLKDVVRHRHLHEGSDEEPVDGLLRPPVFVPESKPVDDLLREMQRGAFHMAMVVDEFGGIAGLVTIEDALEEIVGELTDEHDRSPVDVEDLGDGAYRVPSRLPVDELGELFDLELEDDDVDSAGGLLAKALGKVPLAGSSAVVGGLELSADRVEGRRKQVATLVVRRAPLDSQDEVPDAPPTQGAPR
ncbi:hemolysin family protein [Actinotalea sp. JY-7885]|uniref:hemolysin family protein n=1 Tax=Actinotalea sp. JY-7885 TaxID=2758576 RepID=UPI00165E9A2B|nr:hemolysin family protein [Actinotalea sp. JY-7885]